MAGGDAIHFTKSGESGKSSASSHESLVTTAADQINCHAEAQASATEVEQTTSSTSSGMFKSTSGYQTLDQHGTRSFDVDQGHDNAAMITTNGGASTSAQSGRQLLPVQDAAKDSITRRSDPEIQTAKRLSASSSLYKAGALFNPTASAPGSAVGDPEQDGVLLRISTLLF